jgi:hypothetical protein
MSARRPGSRSTSRVALDVLARARRPGSRSTSRLALDRDHAPSVVRGSAACGGAGGALAEPPKVGSAFLQMRLDAKDARALASPSAAERGDRSSDDIEVLANRGKGNAKRAVATSARRTAANGYRRAKALLHLVRRIARATRAKKSHVRLRPMLGHRVHLAFTRRRRIAY